MMGGVMLFWYLLLTIIDCTVAHGKSEFYWRLTRIIGGPSVLHDCLKDGIQKINAPVVNLDSCIFCSTSSQFSFLIFICLRRL